MTHQPRNPDFEARVRASFARQNAMSLIGARMTRVEPGRVEIELPVRDASASSTASCTEASSA